MGFSHIERIKNILYKKILFITIFNIRTKNGYKKRNEKETFQPATFIRVVGEISYSNENIDLLKELNNDNMDGNKIKIILGSRVTQEGLNFKNISNMHLVNPWYTLKKQKNKSYPEEYEIAHIMK